MNLPPYYTFPELADERILLRQIRDVDCIDISFYDGNQAKTLAQAKEMQAKINADYANGNSIHCGIIDQLSNKIIGTCGYYRRFGYMNCAINLVINFGLEEIRLNRVWAITTKSNEKAIRLLEKLNFAKNLVFDNEEGSYELTRIDSLML